MLALGFEGWRVMLVDEATGEVRWAVQAHAGAFPSTCVAMSPSGRLVASVATTQDNWKLWDAASGAAWMAGATHDGTGACICGVDDEGHWLFQQGCPVVAHTDGLEALAISPCGQWLASGGFDGAVILWDAQTGEAERRMAGASTTEVLSISFSADGARLASAHLNGFIRVWDAATGALLRTLRAPPGGLQNVHFSPTNSRTLATVSADSRIRLWDVDSRAIIRIFAGGVFVAFSQDGRTIATSASDTTHDVLLVNAESGELRLRLLGHQDTALSASFSVDGSKVATGSWDDTCKVWDSSTGALLRTIEAGAVVDSVVWGRDWVRDKQRAVAFAMGHHPRLGAGSRVQDLDAGVVQMILDRA